MTDETVLLGSLRAGDKYTWCRTLFEVVSDKPRTLHDGREGRSVRYVESGDLGLAMATTEVVPKGPDDEELLRRAVESCHRSRECSVRWAHIGKLFGLGSTSSASLARRFGLDPDEVVGTDGAP